VTVVGIVAVLVAVSLAATLGAITYAYVAAALDRRGRRGDCPFENDDDEARPLVREVADVVRETAALVRAVGAVLRPLPGAWRRLSVGPGVGPVVVLVPERHLPIASMAHLGRRLARDLGASIHVEAAGSGAPTDVRAGGLVSRRAAAAVRIPKLRLLTLGTSHRPDREPAERDPLVDRIEVVNVYSLHDALVTPPERAYLAGAYNVALRDEGHFGLLFRARPYLVVREGLADLLPHAAAS
jgi:hypothetical protein